MKRLRISTTAVVSALFLLAVAIACVRSIGNARPVRCEVCVLFHGREACRQAVGESRRVAVRAAQESACFEVGSELSERMQCRGNKPASVRCEDR